MEACLVVNAPLGFSATVPRELLEAASATARRLGLELEPPAGGAEVSWSAVAAALNAHADAIDEGFARRFAVQHVGQSPLAALGARVGLSQRGFAEFLARATAALPLCFSSRYFVGERHLELHLGLQPGLGPCLPWWRLVLALLSQAPTAAGHPPLRLLTARVGATGLVARWDLPPAPPDAGRVPSLLGQLVPLFEQLEVAPAPSAHGEVLQLQRELHLTCAEARVALRVAAGLTARETATDLRVAYQTVRTHLRNINARLELSSQRELVSLIERWRAHRRRGA